MREHIPPPGASPRILVLRRHNHVGDMICSLPLYAALRRRWPEARIELLATPTRYPIPLRELNPFLDSVIYYTKGTLRDVIRAHQSLRKSRYDMAIVPSTIALSRTSHITAFLSGASVRVGVRSIDGRPNGWRMLLNVSKDVSWVTDRVHQEERNREIAGLAGCDITDMEIRALRLGSDEAAEEMTEKTLGPFADGRLLIGVHPGAGKTRNIWPAECFGEALAATAARLGAVVVITAGTLDEREVVALGRQLARNNIDYVEFRNTRYQEMAALFGRLRVYLTNDTGTMHLAAYSGCPTVSLFGPTQAWEWAPRGGSHRAIQSDDGSMQGIPVERVVAAIDSVLTDTR
jgi:ADP-heptose:LPS heptosyltransferase